jgi:ribose transport system substrate-binding protein
LLITPKTRMKGAFVSYSMNALTNKGNSMQKIITRIIIVITLVLLGQSYAFQQTKYKIVVIPKGSTQYFWKAVQKGVNAAARTLKDIEVIWKAPIIESDKKEQISIIEDCIQEGVSGIILSPIDKYELVTPVSHALEKKIPVLIFDSALEGTPGKEFITFVGTDNKEGGNLAGQHLAKLLHGKGKVILLRYAAGQASTTEREEGFLEAIAEHEGIQVIVKDRYAGSIATSAWATSMSLMDKLKESNGVFCPNESLTTGMLQALRQNKLTGKIKFVGFDPSESLIEALQKGEIQALVAQNPILMGSSSVKTLVDYIHGKKVSRKINTGVKLITRDNIEEQEIRQILGK